MAKSLRFLDSSPPGSSVHGISQARILEWVAICFSRESSRSRDQTLFSCMSCIGWQILYYCATNTWMNYLEIPKLCFIYGMRTFLRPLCLKGWMITMLEEVVLSGLSPSGDVYSITMPGCKRTNPFPKMLSVHSLSQAIRKQMLLLSPGAKWLI